MNELALFSGAGGGILAGQLLGWRTVCAVEISAYRARRLMQRQVEAHLPPFPIWDDVCTFDGRPWAGTVDVVAGGFPCTDISSAGNKAGIEGSASSLWFHMARIIHEVRPQCVFIENASALVNRGLGRVLGDLAEMGFDARWGVLGSKHIGAPQGRDRTWVVAHAVPWVEPLGRDVPGGRRFWQSLAELADRETVCQPGFLGKPAGMADRMERLRAIGDGQDPRVAAAAFIALAPNALRRTRPSGGGAIVAATE